MAMSRFVVGVDGSDRARDALQWALAHAGPDDRIEAVHVWDVPVIAGYEGAIAVDPAEMEAAAAQFVGDLAASCADPRVTAMTVRGNAGRALVEAAEGADMLVIGHNGDGRMSLLGSVAQFVVHHTTIPVVLERGQRTGPARHVVVGVDDHDLDARDARGSRGNESVRALRGDRRRPRLVRAGGGRRSVRRRRGRHGPAGCRGGRRHPTRRRRGRPVAERRHAAPDP
jgi:nucleotide-binding universal stress UspA family protein